MKELGPRMTVALVDACNRKMPAGTPALLVR